MKFQKNKTKSFFRLKKKNNGFTLIEIMVVIVILGILSVLTVPKLIGRTDEARKLAAKHDIAVIMQALKLYKLDNFNYPTTDQTLKALVEKPKSIPVPKNWNNDGYIEKIPVDPWGNPYILISPGIYNDIDVMSYGSDGKPGGKDYSEDIGSWQL